MRPRLVHVTTTDMSLDWLLGPQLHAFAATGYEVMAISAPGPHVVALRAAGIHHAPAPHLTRAMNPWSDLRALGELYAACRALQPDIVHTHNPKPGLLGPLAARAVGVPAVVNTIHGLYATEDDPPLTRAVAYAAERITATAADVELVQNEEDVETLVRLGVDRSKLVLLGNGVDLARFDRDAVDRSARAQLRRDWGVADDEVVCGAVGRLVWEKGYAELFAAAARLTDLAPAVRLVVVGPDDPDKRDAVPAAAIAAAEQQGVRFLGERNDVEAIYSAFDLYVLASHREGFPRSAMEAAAMGLPVVATDIRGCRQVVDDGVNGVLVPERDVDGLASAIAEVAADPARRRRMGDAGRRKAERDFDQQRVIDRTLGVYDRLLGTRRRSAATSV